MKYILCEYMLLDDDSRKPNFYYGGRNEKYSDMINITIKDCAKRFNSKEGAQEVADRLKKAGYKFEVLEVEK